MLPGRPAAETVRIEGGSGTSDATTTIDGATLQMRSTGRSTSTLEMVIETSGQTVPMTTETVVEVTITAE